MENKLNIIVIGKSGVGKSSLLNYITDQQIFETGAGTPVTETYFQSIIHKSSNGGITYELHDTKGFEPDDVEQVIAHIKDKIEQSDKSKNIFDWIHSIYYCFSAVAKRLELKEIELIKALSKHCNIVIILTKSDQVDEETIKQLKDEITKEIGEVKIVSVCSVSIETRKGNSKQFGKEDVFKYSFYGLWEKITCQIGDVLYKYHPLDAIPPFSGEFKDFIPYTLKINKAINSFTSNYLDFEEILKSDIQAIDNAIKFYSLLHNVEIPCFNNLYSRRIIPRLYPELKQKYEERAENMESSSYFTSAFKEYSKVFNSRKQEVRLFKECSKYLAECRFLNAFYTFQVLRLRDVLQAEMYMYGNTVFKRLY